MKRGSTDIDWVIAIVLFIIFLLSIFVFLKPGIVQPHKPESLLDIVEDKLRNESSSKGIGIYWTLYETPLYIENKDITVIKCIKIPFTYGWNKNEFDVYKITGDTSTPPDPNNLPDPNKENPLPFYIDGENIVIKTALTNSKDIFIIESSKNDLFSGKGGDLNFDVDCASEVIDQIETVGPEEIIHFQYSYGVTDPINGISLDAIQNIRSNYLDPTKYNDELKPKYGFPLLKEFSVYIKGSDYPNIQPFEPVQPEVDANVFVREWSDFILEPNGIRKPVNVNIRVW